MQDTPTPITRSVFTKVLAIIGFVATCALVLFLIIGAISNAPSTFSSLASIVKSLDEYRPIEKLEVEAKKTVVNSKESFDMTWTDMKQPGEYHVTYACTDGIAVLVRAADGSLVPMKCTDTLTLPYTVHGLFLSIESQANRFADVPFTVRFTNADGKDLLTGTTKVTVVNAQIPVGNPEPVKPEPKDEEVKKPTATTTPEVTVPKPTPKPVVTTVFPTSNPNGTTDLKVTMLGSGIIERGVFMFTPTYDRDFSNAIRFSIKNIGTKTSDTWAFRTKLPDGQSYESKSQAPLKPQEYVEFTIGFSISGNDDLVDITTQVSTHHDVNSRNNKATWSVVVQD